MVEEGETARPFFTIGVTTYKRHELLRQALDSIFAQSFADFEVIVGNDDTDEKVSGEMLGISDPRVRFVNHSHNLREVGNMNALLSMASGRYFTWLNDDDLYEPDFLRAGHDALLEAGYPAAFYCSYGVWLGLDLPPQRPIPRGSLRAMSGRDFLGRYLTGRLKVMSVNGLFDTNVLRSLVGGVEELCQSGVGLYGEYIFLVRCGLFDRVVHSDAPFVIYRAHEGAWGVGNVELDKYREAGLELVRRCGEVLRHPSLAADLTNYLLAICDLHLRNYADKLGFASVSRGHYGVGAMLGSIAMLLAQTGEVRKVFVQAGAADDLRAALRFVWVRCKYSLMIARFIFLRWLRKLGAA